MLELSLDTGLAEEAEPARIAQAAMDDLHRDVPADHFVAAEPNISHPAPSQVVLLLVTSIEGERAHFEGCVVEARGMDLRRTRARHLAKIASRRESPTKYVAGHCHRFGLRVKVRA